MVILAYLAFGLYFCLILGGALAAVFCTGLVRAFVGLIATLLGVAGMYLLLQSPFLAFMQLLIYVGAVSVLIFFALMLADARTDGDEAAPAPAGKILRCVLAGLVPLAVLAPPIVFHTEPSSRNPAQVTLSEIGKALMGDYVLPFELISVILLVSMAGGVLLAWDRRKK
jgi:NADH-quinone oxidoreductase subunit J